MDKLLREKSMVCRTHQRCYWCAETIERGERAVYLSYMFEGYFLNGWQHLECNQIMKNTRNAVLRDGWMGVDAKRGEALE